MRLCVSVFRKPDKKASAEDEQRLTELVEKEIVGRNLLGAFGPLLVSACWKPLLLVFGHTVRLIPCPGGGRRGSLQVEAIVDAYSSYKYFATRVGCWVRKKPPSYANLACWRRERRSVPSRT